MKQFSLIAVPKSWSVVSQHTGYRKAFRTVDVCFASKLGGHSIGWPKV